MSSAESDSIWEEYLRSNPPDDIFGEPNQKQPSSDDDPWILGQIGSRQTGGEAVYGLGYLMYELPIDLVSKFVRKEELKLGSLLDKLKNLKRSERSGSSAEVDSQGTTIFQNLALHQREGHLEGLRMVMNESGTDLLTALLQSHSLSLGNKDASKNKNSIHFVYQIAAILEASGTNNTLRNELHSVLKNSELWKSNRGVLLNQRIPGLNEEELNDESLFKGAIYAPLPKITQSPLDGIYRVWQANRAASTYKRANLFLLK